MSFNRKINQSIKHGYIYLVPTLQLKQFIITTLAKEQGDLLLSWRVDVYEVSIIIWRSDHIHADYFKPWYQLFNIINRAFIFNISIWMLHNVRTLNIYFLAHFKKRYQWALGKHSTHWPFIITSTGPHKIRIIFTISGGTFCSPS